MNIVLAVLFAASFIGLIVLGVVGISRKRDSLVSSKSLVPEDMRRADDGLDGDGSGGPGLAPYFPTN